jgi:hypothetical protein
MENTTIIPTFQVQVQFNWNYPGKPIQSIVKEGFIQSDKTDEKLIADKFINTFIDVYQVGICEISDIEILSVKRVYTFDEWVEKYKPIQNEFEEYGSFEGCVFDYSEDDQWEFVKNQNPDNVWTMVWADETQIIIPGFHWVNRDSYFVTELPVEKEDLSSEYLVI